MWNEKKQSIVGFNGHYHDNSSKVSHDGHECLGSVFALHGYACL